MKNFKTQNTADRKFTVMALYTLNILIGCVLAIYKGVLLGNSIVGFIILLLLNMEILGKYSIQLINKFNRITESNLPSIIFTNMMASINVFMILDIVINETYPIVNISPFITIVVLTMIFTKKILKAIDTVGRM